MSQDTLVVKMAELTAVDCRASKGMKLQTTLGSCVGVVLSDVQKEIRGLAHIMLPEKNGNDQTEGKYADTAIAALVRKMEAMGSRRQDLKAYLFGGACMFQFVNAPGIARIGEKNTEVSLRVLKELGIPVVFQDTGGTRGRTVVFDSLSREPTVRVLQQFARKGS